MLSRVENDPIHRHQTTKVIYFIIYSIEEHINHPIRSPSRSAAHSDGLSVTRPGGKRRADGSPGGKQEGGEHKYSPRKEQLLRSRVYCQYLCQFFYSARCDMYICYIIYIYYLLLTILITCCLRSEIYPSINDTSVLA